MKHISVIIPTYRPCSYFSELMCSINNQTFPSENFEVIIVLNGEYEPYFFELNKVIEEYKKNNIIIIYTPIKGVSNARNIGIEQSKGNYLVFVDDDVLSNNYLEELFNYATEDSIVNSNVYAFKESLCDLQIDYLTKAYFKMRKSNLNSIFFFRSFLSSSCCKIIPKRIIGNYRFDNSISISEDSLFMFQISSSIKAVKIATNEDCIYHRRLRAGSASRSKRKYHDNAIQRLQLIHKINKVYFSNPLNYNFFLYISRLLASMYNLLFNR